MTFLVSADRLAAAFCPLRYLRFTRKTRIIVVLAAFLLATVTIPLAYIFQTLSSESSELTSAECYLSHSLIKELWWFILGFRISAVTISVIFYIPIGYKVRNILKNKSNVTKNKKVIRLTLTIALTTIVSLLLIVIPDIIFLFDFGHLKDYFLLFYLISLNNCVVNVALYSFRHRDLRKAVLSVLKSLISKGDSNTTQSNHVIVVPRKDSPPTRTLQERYGHCLMQPQEGRVYNIYAFLYVFLLIHLHIRKHD
ncbi:hypothetical protein L596_016226 [Steinernema carpocapsae]|uniref:G-protein coupled receptors family 1 profile domain-containing protein n=1 Tax=Steinernema carpocapsae TaxID=34508 RepID=A0A4U5NHC9_STECR|nr:hypothetical protein L596_016226 [Steinernema carpocapsae]